MLPILLCFISSIVDIINIVLDNDIEEDDDISEENEKDT